MRSFWEQTQMEGKIFIMICLAPLLLWGFACDFCVVKGMEGKRQANKGQERSGNLEEMKVMKRWKVWQRAFSKPLRLSKIALKKGECKHALLPTHTQKPEAHLLCKRYSGTQHEIELCGARWNKNMRRTIRNVIWLLNWPVNQPMLALSSVGTKASILA